MSIKHARSCLLRTLFCGFLAPQIAAAAMPVAAALSAKPGCGDWSAELVESVVSDQLIALQRQSPRHFIAAAFAEDHSFHRNHFKYQEYEGGLWMVPFTVREASATRAEHYTALVTCERGVDFTGGSPGKP